jgi:hypothetical protein
VVGTLIDSLRTIGVQLISLHLQLGAMRSLW